jgi:hypothetical protein
MSDNKVLPVPLFDLAIWKEWLAAQMVYEKPISTVDDLAKKSIEDSDPFISETLARITAQQGDTKRAIWMYQQLILKNPEKSDYFALQIENLKD